MKQPKIELVTVFRGTKSNFIKVIGHVDTAVPVLLSEGWVKTVAELPDEEPKHDDLELKIIESESKEDIEQTIKALFNIDLDKRLSLDNLKEKALAVINESKRVD